WIAPGVADSGYMGSVLGAMFGGGYAGIALGTVNYYSLAASQVVIETHDEYRQLLAGSSAVTGIPVLNLFVVGDFGNGATAFTTGQVRVLQVSALYRGILQDGGQPAPPLLIAPQQGAAPAPSPV